MKQHIINDLLISLANESRERVHFISVCSDVSFNMCQVVCNKLNVYSIFHLFLAHSDIQLRMKRNEGPALDETDSSACQYYEPIFYIITAK